MDLATIWIKDISHGGIWVKKEKYTDDYTAFDAWVYETLIPQLLNNQDIPQGIDKADLRHSLFAYYWAERFRLLNRREDTGKVLKTVLIYVLRELQVKAKKVGSALFVVSDVELRNVVKGFNYTDGSDGLFTPSPEEILDQEENEAYQRWFVAETRRCIAEAIPEFTPHQVDMLLKYFLREITFSELVVSMGLKPVPLIRNTQLVLRWKRRVAGKMLQKGIVTPQKLEQMGITGWRERLGLRKIYSEELIGEDS